MPSSSRIQLQGPRPPPLAVNKASFKVNKSADAAACPTSRSEPDRREPVVVYVRTPKIIHARPQDFRSLVQRLTGKSSAPSSSSSPWSSSQHSHEMEAGGNRSAAGIMMAAARKDMDGGGEDGDPLLLTLGQSVPSPIVSPSLFFCSPSASLF